jgi:hypothetical protein
MVPVPVPSVGPSSDNSMLKLTLKYILLSVHGVEEFISHKTSWHGLVCQTQTSLQGR